jgi:hypothetical protein
MANNPTVQNSVIVETDLVLQIVRAMLGLDSAALKDSLRFHVCYCNENPS